MSRIIVSSFAAAMVGTMPFAASAQATTGTVTEYTGVTGQFIVERDGEIYSLSTGKELFAGDVVRMKLPVSGDATVSYGGCTYSIPAGQDITLDDSFCETMAGLEPSEAELAASNTPPPLTGEGAGAGNAPLIIGGIVVAAGGVAAAAGGGGGDGGTPTPTSP